jgi:hypothetical protein
MTSALSMFEGNPMAFSSQKDAELGAYQRFKIIGSELIVSNRLDVANWQERGFSGTPENKTACFQFDIKGIRGFPLSSTATFVTLICQDNTEEGIPPKYQIYYYLEQSNVKTELMKCDDNYSWIRNNSETLKDFLHIDVVFYHMAGRQHMKEYTDVVIEGLRRVNVMQSTWNTDHTTLCIKRHGSDWDVHSSDPHVYRVEALLRLQLDSASRLQISWKKHDRVSDIQQEGGWTFTDPSVTLCQVEEQLAKEIYSVIAFIDDA